MTNGVILNYSQKKKMLWEYIYPAKIGSLKETLFIEARSNSTK